MTTPHPSPTRLIDPDAHRASILTAVTALPSEALPLRSALGRTLRIGVRAAVDIPVFDNSAMDGFAVRHHDVVLASPHAPVELTVVADLPAGTDHDPRLPPGTAARIMTGSPLPADADTIVPFEDTLGGLDDSLGTIRVMSAPRALGAHIRRIGEDVIRGDEIVEAGSALGPLQLAAIAAAGVSQVVVSRPPHVVIVSTGSELVAPGEPLLHGQIPESNGTLLAGLVAETGAIVERRVVIPDDTLRLTALIEELGTRRENDRIDAVIFSGGVSAGAHDVVKQTLSHALMFRQVGMQPGRPQAFGRLIDDCLAFGLPGNPVSVAVSFEVFVRPALLAMQGRAVIERPLITLTAARGWHTPAGRRQYLPVVIDRSDPRRWSVQPAMPRGSHRAGGLARADAYAVVPADVDVVDAGDLVDVMLIE